jgi:hypothetical protein
MARVRRAAARVDSRAAPNPRTWPWLLAIAIVLAAIWIPLGTAAAQTKTVVLMGDSLMFEAAPAVAHDLHPEGYSVNASAAVEGAGLLDTQMDWLVKGQQLVEKYNPSVVVVEYVGNYAYFGGVPGISVYTPAFYTDWAAKAQRLEDILSSRGATVYWVIGPPVGVAIPEKGIVALDRIYRQLHAPHTASGRPPLIDVTPAMSGGTGKYREYLPGPNGSPLQVRQADGVHFTTYGASLFARAVADAVG